MFYFGQENYLVRFFSLSRGLVELRDIVFFGSLIVFFNVLTMFIIGLKTKGVSSIISSVNPKHSFIYLVLLFVGFFSINIIANNTLRAFNYDFTEEKYLTLTKNTKDILRNLKHPVIAKLYYSSILEERNPEIRQIFDQVKLILKQYKYYSKGKFGLCQALKSLKIKDFYVFLCYPQHLVLSILKPQDIHIMWNNLWKNK